MPITFIVKKILRDKDNQIFKKEISKNMKSKSDLIITSGAVSAGKFDFIPSIIKQFKLKSMFKGVNIRPENQQCLQNLITICASSVYREIQFLQQLV